MNKNFFKKILFTLVIFVLFLIILYIIIINIIIDNKLKYDLNKNYSPEIYSEIITIRCNDYFNINKFVKILLLSNYRRTNNIIRTGDFKIKNNEIEIFKRSFNFLNVFEEKIHLKLNFFENKLISIIDIKNNKKINSFKLEPQIICFSNYKNRYEFYNSRKNFSKTLIDILLLVEDKNYFYHKGISFYSIIRALIKNIKKKRIVQGGSTITQQLIKNLFFSCKKSFIRKINEFFMSIIIEYKYSKNKILELYLNKVYFGIINGKEIYGFPLASLCYFNVPINELDLNQQVILISMIKGPSLYNPYKNNNILIERRNLIFNIMKLNNFIDDFLYNSLINKKINLTKKNIINNNKSFIKIIKEDLLKINKKYDNCKKIFSTISLISQYSSCKSSKKIIKLLRKNKKIDNLEISMLVVNYKKGEIKSSIGGFNEKYNGFNRIYINRNIGSIIKPIIYLFGINEKKYQLNTLLNDEKIFYKNKDNKIWSPKNFNNKFLGKVTFIYSLVNSLNIPTINLGLNLGIKNVISFIKNLIKDNKLIIKEFPSIFLGAINLNLLQISQMYQPLANNGNFIKLSSIKNLVDKNNLLTNINYKYKKVFSKKSSYLIMHCMKKIIECGTAKNIIKNPNLIIAGKTGTTNKYIDNWFLGIDDDEICIIWIGIDNNNTTNLSSSNGSMKVYQKYIKYNYSKSISNNIPKNIHYLNTDKFGNIICNKHSKIIIPIYTKNPKKLVSLCYKHTYLVRYINRILNIY